MSATPAIVTVCLNPAIDRTIEVEQFTIGAHQVGREIRRTPGGKGVNVSRALSALGVRTVATGFLGEENRPAFDALFHKTLVGDEFFTLPGRTRENVTITDRATHQETHIRDVGLQIPRRFLQRLAKKLALLADADRIVIFSGSLPPGISPPQFRELVGECLHAGARVAVDTGGAALRAACELPLWLITPNAAELAEVVRRPLPDVADQVEAARELTSRIDTLLLTRGAEGAYLLSARRTLSAKVAVPAGRIRNTVGCGDVLLGAYVAGIWRGRDAEQALAEAVAAATAAACNVSPAEFDAEQLAEFRDKVEVSRP